MTDDGRLGIPKELLPVLYSAGMTILDSENNDADRRFQASTGILVASPEHFTAWNERKRWTKRKLSCPGVDSRVENELDFNAVLLTLAPKSCEAWFHRRWLLRQEGNLGTVKVRNREEKLCLFAAKRAKANYYAWTHRILYTLGTNNEEKDTEKRISEGRHFLQRNISDSSAYHFQRVLLHQLSNNKVNDKDYIRQVIQKECEFSLALAQRYSNVQCPKIHSRLCQSLLSQ